MLKKIYIQYIITIPLYHMSNSSSGTLWTNKTWWPCLPNCPSLSKVTLMAFGTLIIHKEYAAQL